jgi:uncharacterized membrane protein YbhN (UPF0104 family)
MGHGRAWSSRRLSQAASSGGLAWRQHVKSGVLLLVAAVSLYVLLPTLASVFASWRSLEHLDWPFAVLAVACEAASLVCLWELDRIALGTRAGFPIACAQLAGNAVGRIVPGAPTPFAVDMLHTAGFDAGRATAALTASTGLQLGSTAALPLLALPVIVGGAPVSRGLASAAYLGIAVLLLLLAAGTAAFATDRPLELAGRAIQWLLNATVRRDRPVAGLPQQLLADRDFIRTTLGGRWKAAVVAAAANTGFDYLALLCALRAVGAAPRPSLVLLAYTSAPMRSGRVKGRILPSLLVVAVHAGRSRGQGGAPDWTSDLDAGEGRRRIRRREGPGRPTELVSQAPIRASQAGRIRMTITSGPGCSVSASAVSQAHAMGRAHPAGGPSPAGVVVATSLRM